LTRRRIPQGTTMQRYKIMDLITLKQQNVALLAYRCVRGFCFGGHQRFD
jgi:hypothetical protein